MNDFIKFSPTAIFSRDSWRALRDYTGWRGRRDERWLDRSATLGDFVQGRASHIAQTALYGYMKTRAGTSFPSLFEDAPMLASINIAKWQVWLACLSDLAVYSGVLLRLRTAAPTASIRALITQMAERALAEAGAPPEAGVDFAAAAKALGARLEAVDFAAYGDDESAFTASPKALVYWAPVADELKNRDVEIIRNSVRFRWQEVRRVLRRRLRAEALMRAQAQP